MQLFSVDAIVFSKKNLTFCFDPENINKLPSKVAHNWPQPFFMYWPDCPIGPETEIPNHQQPLNSDPSLNTQFRLGSEYKKQ